MSARVSKPWGALGLLAMFGAIMGKSGPSLPRFETNVASGHRDASPHIQQQYIADAIAKRQRRAARKAI